MDQQKISYQHPISVDEMWSLTNREEKNWGIEGYEVHKKYFDSAQEKKLRERNALNEKVWARRGHYPKINKVDKDGKEIIIKRPNYLDEVVKLANSFYNKERAEKLKEELAEKSLKPLAPKKVQVVQRAPRELFTDWMIKNEKKKNKENTEINGYDELKEKIKKHNKDREKLPMDMMKEKYQGDKGRRGTTCCERVSVTSEAIFVGEQIPFYNTAPPKVEGDFKYEDLPGGLIKQQIGSGAPAKEKKYKKNKVLFFPRKYCLSTWTKAPQWVIKGPVPKEPDFNYAAKDEALKEKVAPIIEKIKADKKSRLNIDVPISWYLTNYHGRISIGFAKTSKPTDNYTEWKKNNPPVHPGPQHYWKRNPVKFVSGKAKPQPVKIPEPEDGKKTYVLDDKYQMKHVYKPMKGHIF